MKTDRNKKRQIEAKIETKVRELKDKTWRLNRTVQCAKCPWRKSTDPHEIPNGYCEEKHAALEKTIAKQGDLSGLFGTHHVMACHEEHESYCVGWLVNQCGAGNNIAMRITMMSCENASAVRTVGEQHQRFEDTLP